MRRFIKVMALLVMILAGSWPAAYLGGTPGPEPCPCGAPHPDPCPCRPTRSSGPTAPSGAALAAPVAILAAPCAQARAGRPEPRPIPAELLARAGAELLEAGPTRLARPGPLLLRPGSDLQASLSVFRI